MKMENLSVMSNSERLAELQDYLIIMSLAFDIRWTRASEMTLSNVTTLKHFIQKLKKHHLNINPTTHVEKGFIRPELKSTLREVPGAVGGFSDVELILSPFSSLWVEAMNYKIFYLLGLQDHITNYSC